MWIYQNNQITSITDVPEEAIGFIYLLTNKETGKKYIGKKFLYSERKKLLTQKEKALPENKRKKYKHVKTESDWLTYSSSSKDIQVDIKEGAQFDREILHFTFSKLQTTYLEVKLQFVNEVLEREDWYNNNINSSWFRGNIGMPCARPEI